MSDKLLYALTRPLLFSLDPETGFDKVVSISGAWGLGENVVQGAVDPDEFLVFKPLLDDPARRAAMGAYNRARFLDRMSWEHSSGELLRAYVLLCAPNRGA